MGANAFALPSGLIIMTDDLVRLAEDDRELGAVLLHEMAHVERRHGVRALLQHAGVFLIVSTLAGDLTAITSLAGALPTMLVESGYSRDFEREADRDAARRMLEMGWGTGPFARMLRRLGAGRAGLPSDVTSSHPLIEERVRNLRALETEIPGRAVAPDG